MGGLESDSPYPNDPDFADFMRSTDYSNGVAAANAGQKVGDVFSAWKAKRDAANQEHDQYVQLSQANKGRQATIFTAPGTDPVVNATPAGISPTLLNENATNRKKSLIGGY